VDFNVSQDASRVTRIVSMSTFEKNKVKIKDYSTFVEVVDSVDGGRPLEWRRRLRKVSIDVDNFSVGARHWINECDMVKGIYARNRSYEEILPVVKAKLKSQLRISCKVPFSSIRDRFYSTLPCGEEGDVFDIVKTEGVLDLDLVESEGATDQWNVFDIGAFQGYLMIDKEQEFCYLEVSMSSVAINSLLEEIRAGRVEKISLDLMIDSFEFELDEALRDWHHAKDLLIHGLNVPAGIESFSIVPRLADSSLNQVQLRPRENASLISEGDGELGREKNSNLAIDAAQFKSIKIVLWGIFFVLFMLLFK
jgi:hypothetical protein